MCDLTYKHSALLAESIQRKIYQHPVPRRPILVLNLIYEKYPELTEKDRTQLTGSVCRELEKYRKGLEAKKLDIFTGVFVW